MDKIMIALSKLHPNYLSITSKMHLDSDEDHRASISNSNTSYVLFSNTAQNLWVYRLRYFHHLLYYHVGKKQSHHPDLISRQQISTE